MSENYKTIATLELTPDETSYPQRFLCTITNCDGTLGNERCISACSPKELKYQDDTGQRYCHKLDRYCEYRKSEKIESDPEPLAIFKSPGQILYENMSF